MPVGATVGNPVGATVGDQLGKLLGLPEGALLGKKVGGMLGVLLGRSVGAPDGPGEGWTEGASVGAWEGISVGLEDGMCDGCFVDALSFFEPICLAEKEKKSAVGAFSFKIHDSRDTQQSTRTGFTYLFACASFALLALFRTRGLLTQTLARCHRVPCDMVVALGAAASG